MNVVMTTRSINVVMGEERHVQATRLSEGKRGGEMRDWRGSRESRIVEREKRSMGRFVDFEYAAAI